VLDRDEWKPFDGPTIFREIEGERAFASPAFRSLTNAMNAFLDEVRVSVASAATTTCGSH
jgi:hypothetical protein